MDQVQCCATATGNITVIIKLNLGIFRFLPIILHTLLENNQLIHETIKAVFFIVCQKRNCLILSRFLRTKPIFPEKIRNS